LREKSCLFGKKGGKVPLLWTIMSRRHKRRIVKKGGDSCVCRLQGGEKKKGAGHSHSSNLPKVKVKKRGHWKRWMRGTLLKPRVNRLKEEEETESRWGRENLQGRRMGNTSLFKEKDSHYAGEKTRLYRRTRIESKKTGRRKLSLFGGKKRKGSHSLLLLQRGGGERELGSQQARRKGKNISIYISR